MPVSIRELQAQGRWVLWRLEMVRNNRGELVPTKVPIDGAAYTLAAQTGEHGAATRMHRPP